MRIGTGIVKLTYEEQQIARLIAKMRTDTNKSAGTHKNWGSKDPYEIDLISFGAEMAWAKTANLYPDFTTQIRSGSADFTFGYGGQGDVKWTGMEPPRLLVKVHKVNDPYDLYVLMTGQFPEYEIQGFATKDQIFNARIKDYGYGDTYTMFLDELLTEVDI